MTSVRVEAPGGPLDAAVTRDGERVTVVLDGAPFTFLVKGEGLRRTVTGEGGTWAIERRSGRVLVDGSQMDLKVTASATGGAQVGAGRSAAHVKPPMTGRLESLRVQVGQSVAKGDVLFILEAMKMLNEVRAPVAGTVLAVHAAPGATLETGQAVLDIGPAA